MVLRDTEVTVGFRYPLPDPNEGPPRNYFWDLNLDLSPSTQPPWTLLPTFISLISGWENGELRLYPKRHLTLNLSRDSPSTRTFTYIQTRVTSAPPCSSTPPRRGTRPDPFRLFVTNTVSSEHLGPGFGRLRSGWTRQLASPFSSIFTSAMGPGTVPLGQESVEVSVTTMVVVYVNNRSESHLILS